jgi:hypothetical protein
MAFGLLVVFAGLGLVTLGCGGPDYEGEERAAVSGSVTLDGNAVTYGVITFSPAGEGRTASGPIQDGKYAIDELNGPNLGPYKVQILGYEKAPEGIGADGGEGSEEEPVIGEEGAGEDEEEQVEGSDDVGDQIVPPKYNTATELEVEITSGENTHDFPLTSG